MTGATDQSIADAIDRQGYAVIPAALSPSDCDGLVASYETDGFRSTVTMARHGFGQGEYRYFAYPLPATVQRLREELYAHLAPVANAWEARLNGSRIWPARHADLAAQCALAGQARPTPLLLRYGPGDHNRLHQDLYGAIAFPLQAIALLSRPGDEFDGGELILVESQARRQSRPMVVPLRQGDIAIVPTRERPVARASGGWARAAMRHGVAEVRRGRRHTLGIIFHDAA